MTAFCYHRWGGWKHKCNRSVFGNEYGKCICLFCLLLCMLSYSGVKSVKQNSNLLGVWLRISLESKQKCVRFPADGVTAYWQACLSCYLVFSLTLLVYIFTYYILSASLNVSFIWSLYNTMHLEFLSTTLVATVINTFSSYSGCICLFSFHYL